MDAQNQSDCLHRQPIIRALNGRNSSIKASARPEIHRLPRITCFYATPTSVALGGTTTLHWCVTGADTITISPQVGSVSPANSSISAAPPWDTDYVLVAGNPFGITTLHTRVTVTGPGAPCGNIGAADAWSGILGFSYSVLGQSPGELVKMNRTGNVNFQFQKVSEGPFGVTYDGYAAGSLTIHNHDELSGNPPSLTTLDGSGNPVSPGPELKSSLVSLHIIYDTCTYAISFNPVLSATQVDSGGHSSTVDASLGEIDMGRYGIGFPLNYRDRVGYLTAHSIFWNTTPDALTDGFPYFPGIGYTGPGAPFVSEDALSSAYVATIINPVYP